MVDFHVDCVDDNEWKKLHETIHKWQNAWQITNSDHENDDRLYIWQFIQHIWSIIRNIQKWDNKLFTNTCDHWIAYLVTKKLYCDLFDVLFYFGWFLNECGKNLFEIDEYLCYHFEETIYTWLLVTFVDKLPPSRPFTGDFDTNCVSSGGTSMIEFFVELKTRMTMMYPILERKTCIDIIDNCTHPETFRIFLPCGLYQHLQQANNYNEYVGSFRRNFITSAFLLTNRKHLNNRKTLVESLFARESDPKLNYYWRNHEVLASLFLKDVAPFGTKQEYVINELNIAQWIELFEHERRVEMGIRTLNEKDSYPYDFNESKLILEHAMQVDYDWAIGDNWDNIKILDDLEGMWHKWCTKVNSLNHASIDNEYFVHRVNNLIDRLNRCDN